MALISVSNNALSNITALPAGLPTGALTLLSTQTASSSASIEFTSGIDSTYDSYVFKFIDINVGTNGAEFEFQGSTDGGTSYGVTMTTTFFRAGHTESDSDAFLAYAASSDLNQSTSFQRLKLNQGNNSDDSLGGFLNLFNPSSTTFMKHFISTTNHSHDTGTPQTVNPYIAGYFNSTSAINALKFQPSTGTFSGTIKMYGVK